MQSKPNPATRRDTRTWKRIADNLYEESRDGRATGRFQFRKQTISGRVQEVGVFKTQDGRASRDAARKWADGLRADVDRGQVAPADKTLTLRELRDSWLAREESALGRLAPSTRQLYVTVLDTHVLPVLGQRAKVADVRVEHVRKVIDRLTAEGKSGSTARNTRNAMSAIFRHAARDLGAISRNPVRDLERGDLPPGTRRTEPRYLSVAQVEALLSKLTDESRPIAATMFYAACRVSEALALTWGDLDAPNGVLRVPGTKTAASKGVVPLHPRLAEELQAHRRRVMRLGFDRVQPSALIFTTKSGEPVSRRNVLRAVANAGKRAGLQPEGAQPIGCHDLRHSAAAAAFSLKLEPAKVAALLRHANPSITMKVYAGLSSEAVAQLGKEWAAVGASS